MSSVLDSQPQEPHRPSAGRRRAATRLLMIKSSGYLVSTLSVILLGFVSWRGASKEPLLMLCLVAGAAASIGGMVLRWLSYRIEEQRKADGRDG